MRVIHADGVEGAQGATGVVVVIDVLRAFTVSAVAFDRGAREAVLVRTVEEARRLQGVIPRSVISAEVGGRPIAGIPISNSPTQLAEVDLQGRTLIQRTSAGTQCVVAAQRADVLFAGSLVVARATCRALAAAGAEQVTFVASGGTAGHLEDRACALFMASLLEARPASLPELLAPFYASERYRRLAAGEEPGFPRSDLDLALAPDRFDFAMQVSREERGLMLRPVRAGA